MKGLKAINMRFYGILLLILFTAGRLNASAANIQLQVKTLTLDTVKVKPRQFDQQKLAQYKKLKDFQYREQVLETERSLWSRFWGWFWQQISRILGAAGSNQLVRTLLLAALAALVVYVAIKIFGSHRLFAKKSERAALSYDVLNEDIHQIDYETEISKLINEGRYRLAVRLLYLRSLKRLTDASLINWAPGKTNSVYLEELADPALKNPFGLLTRKFDYIWYGDFPVDAQSFEPIRSSFDEFNRLVK